MPSFLFDNNASPGASEILREAGMVAVHVKEIGHDASSDRTIIRLALERGDVIVTYDNDFPEILSHSGANGPSVVLLREGAPTRAKELAAFLSSLAEDVTAALAQGAVVVCDGRRVRIRRLPLR